MSINIVFHTQTRASRPLPPPWGTSRSYRLERRASIKDIIEALGVPHPEIERLLVNGGEVSFSWIPGTSDRVDVYPLSPPFDVLTPSLLRPVPLSSFSFLIDLNVGKLAGLLRMLGFNAAFHGDLLDHELAEIAGREGRILLTRDRNLLKRKKVIFGYLVKESEPRRQLAEVVRLFGLKDKISPFSRCLRCNGMLKQVDKTEIIERLEPLTRKYYDSFKRCTDCDQIYWPGSHKERMDDLLNRILT